MSEQKTRLTDEMKRCMKAGEKDRLAVIRMCLAAIKQKEVDERISVTDEHVVDILTKMMKQRKESLSQYESAGREDLASQERYELDVIAEFLPQQMSEDDIRAAVTQAIAQTGANSPKDMGKVMGSLTAALKGKADMSVVSQIVKASLS